MLPENKAEEHASTPRGARERDHAGIQEKGRFGRWHLSIPASIYCLIGVIAAAPFAIALHSDLLWEADSGRLLAEILYVPAHGFDYALKTQEVLLPHLILRPFVEIGGIPGARLVPMLSLPLLAGLVSYMTGKLTDSLLASLAAALALLSIHILVVLASRLTLYLLAFTLAYLGMWIAHRSIFTDTRRGWVLAATAAALLVLATEAHGLGQLFLGGPLLFLILQPSKTGVKRVARVLSLTGLLLIPRAIINLSDGGLTAFRSNRADYFVTNGYLAIINQEFWNHPVSKLSSPMDYMRYLPEYLGASFTSAALASLLLLGLGFVVTRGRARFMAVAVPAFFVLALLISRPAPRERYWTVLVPAMAIGAGVAVGTLMKHRFFVRVVALAAVLGLALTGTLPTYHTARAHAIRNQAQWADGPFPRLAQLITDEKAIIGARTPPVQQVSADVRIYGSLFLTEQEYVTFLTWPSDAGVIDMMNKRDIGWVMVHRDLGLEVDYHQSWVSKAHGLRVRHPEAVARSPAFCLVAEIQGVKLYKLRPCADDIPLIDPGDPAR